MKDSKKVKKTRKKYKGMIRMRTKYKGVHQRESDTKTFKGKPDICFDITYKRDGKKVFEKIGWMSEGYSLKVAADVRADRMRSVRHGEELPRDKKKAPLFMDIAKKYLEWAKDNKKDHRNDESRYNKHIAPRFEKKRMDAISTFDLERLKSELLKENLAEATVKHCLVLVRQIFNKALAWGDYKGVNPIKGVKLPQLQNQRERFLSYAEADLLLRELEKRSPIVHDMALLSLHTGMRAGEIFGMRGHDVDLRHGLISILDPKNKTPRKAHMTTAIRDMLSRRVVDLGPDQFIFLRRGYENKPSVEISDTFHRTADELFNKGVKDRRQKVTFHSLRHTFASWLALQGESLMTLREMLGHKSFAMTQRYAHLIPDEKRRATAALEKAFSEGKAQIEDVQNGMK